MIKNTRVGQKDIKMSIREKKPFVKYLSLDNGFVKNFNNVTSVLADKSLAMIFEFLLLDIDKFWFDANSSVNQNTQPFGLHIELDRLMDVNLKFHTFGVFNYACNLDVKQINRIKDYIILACFAHDFGKSIKLCAEYDLDFTKPHYEVSADYLKKVIAMVKLTNFQSKFLEAVLAALYVHHAVSPLKELMEEWKAKQPKNDKDREREDWEILSDLILKYLKKCDIRQRQYETENIEEIKKYQELYKFKQK